jgi:hypothetical protein
MGGVPPIAPALISGLGSSERIPRQFIPVGQGFFVIGKTGSGGTITYKNSQRAFHKEDESGISNSMFKTATNSKKPTSSSINSNDPTKKDNFMKIRLGFNSHNKYHRQILLGFMDENASSNMDYGYDSLNMDDCLNDMYFLNGENQLAIQGEGFFKEENSYPLGVKTDAEGKVTFMIDELENFNKNLDIFIYDKENMAYHNLKREPFEILLPKGIFNSRFYLCFNNKKHKNNDDKNGIKTSFSESNRKLQIANTTTDSTVSKVSLFNILGQYITKWDITDQNQTNIQIPILNISSGIYIVKLSTSNGEISEKIIIP